MHALRLTATALALLTASLPLTAQTLDPDPDIFDGTHTRTETPASENPPPSDDWQQAHLILYDSEEQGLPIAGTAGTVSAPGIPGSAPIGGGPALPTVPTAAAQPAPSTPPGVGSPTASKPADVSIGDARQTIATSAQPMNPIKGGQPPADETAPAEPSKGTDHSPSPGGANGRDSGQRGGGVEKGDAMPTDI